MKAMAIGLFAMLQTLQPEAAQTTEKVLAPFVAEYDVRYGNMGVGSSRTELSRSSPTDRWIIESRSTASGLARIIASGTLVQRSTFELTADDVRPLSYTFDDGTKRTGRDVTLDFDWSANRVRGTAEDEPVDLAVSPGLQDAASMQALVLARLRSGGLPGTIPMIEKDRIKQYHYTFLRHERLKTTIGEFETVVYRSAREGSSRETISWFAPELGHAIVQAEQRIDGKKRGFQTLIRAFNAGR